MIIVKLMGGLGNQMFQYAAGRSLAIENDTKLYMDSSWFEIANSVDTPRVYELDCFNIKASFIPPGKMTLIEKYEPTLKSKIYKLTKGLRQPYVVHIKEKNHEFDGSFLKLGNNTYLDGFWQSEKYFKDKRLTLLEDFSYRKEPSIKNTLLLKEIKTNDAVSLHVRRGDYASNKSTNAYHGLTSLDYYKTAVELISKNVKNPHFYIFSDEPEWCKKNLQIDFPTVYISHNKDGSEDMRLMRHCKHNIIANSSFSWWGGWLNNHPNKIVIAPKVWFQNKESNDGSEIVPESWMRL